MTPSSTTKADYVERSYRCGIANKANGRCQAPAQIAQAKLDEWVESVALGEIDRLAITAAERSTALDEAQRALQAAQAELVAYQRTVRVTDVGAEAFTEGNALRAAAVDQARDLVARARLAVGPLPTPGTLRDAWPTWEVEERAHVLRGALSVVWVARGRGPCDGRVRVIAAGHGPVKPRGGWVRMPLQPLEWVEDLPGEIRPAGAQHP